MDERRVRNDGVDLAVERQGEGPAVVLLHGLTATRRYVVMGSRALPRAGFTCLAYDARGHGRSSAPGDPQAYGYAALRADLEAVLDDAGEQRAVLAGASMGAHTALALALAAPERVAGLVVITPAYDPATQDDPARLARWDALADGLRTAGVEGFLAAYGEPDVPERLRDTVRTVLRQRLGAHERPEAVADALSAVPRSRPFGALEELEAVRAPTIVVASGDEADPGHPFAVGEAYARAIPGAVLRTEAPGASPLAWQGGQLSAVIGEVAARALI